MGGVLSSSGSDAASLSSTSSNSSGTSSVGFESNSSAPPSVARNSSSTGLGSLSGTSNIPAASPAPPTTESNIANSTSATSPRGTKDPSPPTMTSSGNTTSVQPNGPSTIASGTNSSVTVSTSLESTFRSATSTSVGGKTNASAPLSGKNSQTSPLATTGTKGQSISFTATSTSTITDSPQTTLSTASFVAVVTDGHTSLSAPPFLTVVSTSTEPNGVLITYTHVVANGPTAFAQDLANGHKTFFHNAGAVAGVFLVVGVILTAMVAFGLFICCRRKRRRREAHRRWLISVNRPRRVDLDDPFQTPPMVEVNRPEWDSPVRSPHLSTNGLGLYDIASPSPRRIEPRRFDSLNANQIGLAITTAESSPSIYPASLPPNEEVVSPRRSTDLTTPPPRPRRSHLRVPPPTHLVTPPESEGSHSPVSETATAVDLPREQSPPPPARSPKVHELIGRRTLLDVRPLSQEGIPSRF